MGQTKSVSRVIAIEEAFLHPKMWEHFPEALQKKYNILKGRLMDVGPDRIRLMDAAGIDMQVLSHVQPGVQIVEDAQLAIALCKEVNDWLGDIVKTYPSRFAGFAMLPTQSPNDAADELERTVKEFGFKGALINGHTHGRYLDDPGFSVLLERAQALDVPIYIHPTDPPAQITDTYYKPHEDILITTWGWPVETGTHLLKMICGGVFDRYPDLKIIVGHMGELLPFCYTRMNMGLSMGAWLMAATSEKDKNNTNPSPAIMQKSLDYYMHKNVYITSSGVFDQPVFNCTVAMLGIKNLMFSVDEPFQNSIEAMDFLNASQLSQDDKEWFAHGNAEQLLKLPMPDGTLAGKKKNTLKDSLFAFKARAKARLGKALIAAMVK